jgi:hypothetical protein
MAKYDFKIGGDINCLERQKKRTNITLEKRDP